MLSRSLGARVVRRMDRRNVARNGFSMLELLIVVTIILVIAAIATPNLMRALANMRLRENVQSVAGLLQQARIRAVKDNTYYRVFGYTSDGSVTTADTQKICLDTDNNATCVTTSATKMVSQGSKSNPQLLLGGTAVMTTSAPPTTVDSKADFSSTNFNIIEQDKNIQVYFNSRGLPCVMSGSVCKSYGGSGNKPYAYVYYMTDQRPLYGWAAVTVSPMGRIRTWMYNGSTWEQ